ncbi:MAG TPA: cytochrome c oxidase subunit II [Bryobacteraceae bacterium]|nr:cytochrome c oxidase subunit II [Bryobacteraceae bacterium]
MRSAAFHSGPASSISAEYDWFFWVMVTVCTLVAAGIAIVLLYSMIRFHRKRENQMGSQRQLNIPLEVSWTVIPFFAFMGMFAYGAKLYFDIERPPDNAIPVYVIAKQWMWKLQHPGGQREINELHVPIHQPIRLTMTSQDVIHSFYVPEFRIKQDVLPGRYTSIWFEATDPGKYHLLCAEYCGTKHSGMIGWVYAMEPRDYQAWLRDGGAEGSLASMGEKWFHQFACANCHHFDNAGRCPDLRNLFGRAVELNSGETVIADEGYIRESILDPHAKIVNGYQDIMPTFKGQISEEQIIDLISFIKAIGPQSNVEQHSSSGSVPQDYGNQKGIAGPGTVSISGTKPEKR